MKPVAETLKKTDASPEIKPVDIRLWKKDEALRARASILRKMEDIAVEGKDFDLAKPIPFKISSEAVDRDTDTIALDGWKTDHYNGVVLFGHQSYELPVGKSTVYRSGRFLMADCLFVKREVYDFGGTVGEMVAGGFLRSTSVGFRPLKWEVNAERESPYGSPGYDFKEQELLEWSVVPVPSNWEATVGAAKSAGIDMLPMRAWAEMVLDVEKGAGLWVPRKDLEAVAKMLGSGKVFSIPAAKPKTVTLALEFAADCGFSPEEVRDLFRSVLPKKGVFLGHAVVKNDDDLGDTDPNGALAGHVAKLGEVCGKMETAHAALDQTYAGMKQTHSAICDATAKLAAVLSQSDDDGATDGASADAGATKGAAEHALSKKQYKRVKQIKSLAAKAMAAHHGSDSTVDDDEAEPDEDDKAAADAIAAAFAPKEEKADVKDVDFDALFAKGVDQVVKRVDAQMAAVKAEITGKAH